MTSADDNETSSSWSVPRYARFMLFRNLYQDDDEYDEEKREVLHKYPYPRFHMFSAGLHYDDYVSRFDLGRIYPNFLLLSVAEGENQLIDYLDNKHKQIDLLKLPNPRFQLCTAKLSVHKHSASNDTFYKKYVVYGYIMVSDRSVSRDDGWVPLNLPMYRFASVLNREFYQPAPITNTRYLHYITNPSTRHSVSLPNFLDIDIHLYAFGLDVNEDKEFFQVVDGRMVLDFSVTDTLDTPMSYVLQGPDGCAKLNYIIFSDAVDATLEIIVRKTDLESPVFENPVCVKIVAHYGDEIDFTGEEKSNYYLGVFLEGSVMLLDDMILELENSVFAVHDRGSLIIEAFIGDSSAEVIMCDSWKFEAKREGSSTGSITGTDCSLDLKVNWKY